MDRTIFTNYDLLKAPPNWTPPTWSFDLITKFSTRYYQIRRTSTFMPKCRIKVKLNGTNECSEKIPVWWHPWAGDGFCSKHIEDWNKNWFFTNWHLLKYYKALSLLSEKNNLIAVLLKEMEELV